MQQVTGSSSHLVISPYQSVDFLLAKPDLTSLVLDRSALSSSIDSIIRLKMPRSFNGVILIAEQGQEIYKRSYGFRDLKRRLPLDLTNQFIIGSVSKQVTATLVLREVQNGRLALNRTIRSYLSGFPEQWADSVTLQQLLNHTSGIAGWAKPLAFKPGSRFSYTNLNYNILGQVIEKTSGRTYAELSAELFKTAGMTHTMVPSALIAKADQVKLVKGYNENAGKKKEEVSDILDLLNLPVMSIPATGIISCAEDLSRWNYSLHGGKFLSDSVYKLMISSSVIRPHRWGELNYGGGIQIDHLDKIDELSMSGYVPGFISTVIYFPARKISVVILENISPAPDDMSRVYYFHDQIRAVIRTQLKKKFL